MKDNPFLDDLFPDAFRARKGRVARSFEYVPSTAAFRFSALSSRKKAEGVANNRTEVMLRIGPANVKSYLHVIKTADYVARHGKIELRDQDGQVFFDKAAYRQKLYDWKILSAMGDGESKKGHVRRIILSMPSGTDVEKFKAGCNDWAKEMLSGFDYLIAFHTAENDEKTTQPHCHILVRTLNKEGKRFHLDNGEFQAFREHFASCLIRHGIEANATRRWSRGRTEKAVSQAEHHVSKNRSLSNEDRARIYAMSKKRDLLRRQKSRIENVVSASRRGKPIEDHPSIVKAKKTRKRVAELVSNAVEVLNSSDETDDRILAEKLSSRYKHLAPVESKEQRMLRELNEAKAKTIKRIQAMKKRQRKADPIKYR